MIEQINFALYHLINQYAGVNPLIDIIAVFAAQYMPVIIILVLAYLWFKRNTSTKNIILYAVYAAIIGLAINYIIGLIYFHPRPFMIPTGTILFPYLAESSFPSDHTTLMASLALMLIYFKETRSYGVILLILGLIGGFARVFSGVHFPFDILGSLLISIIITTLIYQFRDKFSPLNRFITNNYSKLLKKIRN